ncbi:urease accessory protein UreD [Oceanicola sp. 22II-s10i]|uniref:urease accessory protein UreD n=1 Tax=Oceanicola sp. 22II-s10i TaxID=1317116 RepID=UPI0020CC5DD1|nr:urease accessory protein UreD [Oceanicola sp. 22II-s10i]
MTAVPRGGRSRIGRLRQQGSFKALFPHGARQSLQAVFLNTAGGITGGDRFLLTAGAETGAHLVMTSQAAERAYRAQPDEVGRLTSRLSVAGGARLDWLPQETILFEGAALERRIEADVAGDGRFLAVEPVIFGRAAMGEVVHDASLTDHWRIRRDGRLIYADSLRLSGDIAARLADPAVADGGMALASMVLVAPGAEDFCSQLNDLMGEAGAASAPRDGVLVARFVAADGFALRRALIPAIRLLTGDDIPRPWML